MIINRKDIAKNISKNYAEPASGPFNHRLKSLKRGNSITRHQACKRTFSSRRLFQITSS